MLAVDAHSYLGCLQVYDAARLVTCMCLHTYTDSSKYIVVHKAVGFAYNCSDRS